ncbi:hypothetical protein GOV05_04695 [Candidatus Woesearchaeota archaeon]|nr:hypothetical protein [Candidatus Woesearchaeota archaeon]
MRNINLALIILSSFFLLGASFDVGVEVPPVGFYYDQIIQITPVVVGGNNITIRIPLSYYFNTSTNITTLKPLGWLNGFMWSVFEEVAYKNVSFNSSHITWGAQGNSSVVYLDFDVVPPVMNVSYENITPVFYEKNFTISAPNHFVNVSASTNISQGHSAYYLYWLNQGNWLDKTTDYNLIIINETAFFSGFNTSTQYFKLEGYCVESWTCTAWSQNSCGTRVCVDQNSCGTTIFKPSEDLTCISWGGGGGGGDDQGEDEQGVIINGTKTFLGVPQNVSLNAFLGDTFFHSLIFKSVIDSPINLVLEQNDLIRLTEHNFFLKSNISKEIGLYIDANTLGLFEYELRIRSEGVEKTSLIRLNITKKPLSIFLENPELLRYQPIRIGILLDEKYRLGDDLLIYLRNEKRLVKIVDSDQEFVELFLDLEPREYDICASLHNEKLDSNIFSDCQKLVIRESPFREAPSKTIVDEAGFDKTIMLLGILVLVLFFIRRDDFEKALRKTKE